MIRRSSRAGTTAVEMALITPLVLMLTVTVLELGWQMCVAAALDYGARRAARVGMTGTAVGNGPIATDTVRQSAIRSAILTSTGGLLVDGRLTVGMASFNSIAAAGAAITGGSDPGGAGQVVRYSLQYTEPLLTGSLASALLNRTQFVHTSTVMVINEPFSTN